MKDNPKVLARTLTPDELGRCLRWLYGPRQPWAVSGHCRERMEEYNLSLVDLDRCYRRGQLIEVSPHGQHLRFLLRDGRGVCIVVCPARWHIVTCYRNLPNDCHYTLDHNRYLPSVPPNFFSEVPATT